MAACMAPAWPSQQRSARGTSERHSALARMRERHSRAERFTPEVDAPPSRSLQQPRPPAQARSTESRPGPRLGSLSTSGNADVASSRAEPWDDESPPPKPQRPIAPEEAVCKGRPARPEKTSDEGRSTRVRGPAEVKTARGNAADDDDLPPGAQSADFKTLHAMIARGIHESETGSIKLETDIPLELGVDEEEHRFRERQRQRREQEAAQREVEREQARQRRRKEQDQRERRQAEELEREEREELSLRESRAHAEAQCRKELAAALRIQSRMRGRWTRMGKPPVARHHLKAVLHWEPFVNGSMLQS